MFCNTTLPLKADVYYATPVQNTFGQVEKTWTFDQTIRCAFNMTTNYKDQQIQPDQMFWVQDILGGRTIVDPRIDSNGNTHAMTDVLITKIRNDQEVEIYLETAGVRDGLSTVFEIAGVLPHNGPFASVDYYKTVIKRSDIQELGDE